FAVHEFGEADTLPAAAAQQGMGVGHRVNAALERIGELHHRTAALARALHDRRDTREHALAPGVEFGNEQALVLLCSLVLGNIAGQSLEPHAGSSGVELA